MIIFKVLWYFSLLTYFSKCHFFKFGVTLKQKYSMDFHGRGPDLLEIYSTKPGRVGNIKNILFNNYKIVKYTKKT